MESFLGWLAVAGPVLIVLCTLGLKLLRWWITRQKLPSEPAPDGDGDGWFGGPDEPKTPEPESSGPIVCEMFGRAPPTVEQLIASRVAPLVEAADAGGDYAYQHVVVHPDGTMQSEFIADPGEKGPAEIPPNKQVSPDVIIDDQRPLPKEGIPYEEYAVRQGKKPSDGLRGCKMYPMTPEEVNARLLASDNYHDDLERREALAFEEALIDIRAAAEQMAREKFVPARQEQLMADAQLNKVSYEQVVDEFVATIVNGAVAEAREKRRNFADAKTIGRGMELAFQFPAPPVKTTKI